MHMGCSENREHYLLPYWIPRQAASLMSAKTLSKEQFRGFVSTIPNTERPKGGEDPEGHEKEMPKWAPNLELPKGAK
jgi:hypothetical protein